MAKLVEIVGKPLSGEWGKDDETGEGIPVIRTTNFENDGTINYNNVVTRKIIKKDIENKYLQEGDIIIEKSGGSDKFPVGRVVYFKGQEKKYLFNNFTGLLRVQNKQKWYPRYVFYSLFANYKMGGTRVFENKTTGIHNLKIDDYMSRYEIGEKSYIHQVTICERLDKIYEIIKFRKNQLQLFNDLLQARFVTDHISVTHHIISDIITFAITNLHDEMEKSNFLPPTNSYISAPMPPILPTTHQMVS